MGRRVSFLLYALKELGAHTGHLFRGGRTTKVIKGHSKKEILLPKGA